MLTDHHCHILPGIDDGSDSMETSLAMIRLMKEQGVERIVSTSHFYAHREGSVQAFLEKRNAAYAALMQANPAVKNILLGAEVAVERGIAALPGLQKLAIQGTNCILMEFPYRSYEPWMEAELDDITVKYGLEIVIAHVHRYLAFYSKSDLEKVLGLNAVFQINNEAFEKSKERKLVKRMIKDDYPLIFGSDAHNMRSRKPNWDVLQRRAKADLIADSDRFIERNRANG